MSEGPLNAPQAGGAVRVPVEGPAHPEAAPSRKESLTDLIDAVGRNKDAVVGIVHALGSEFTTARNAHLHVSKHLSWTVWGSSSSSWP